MKELNESLIELILLLCYFNQQTFPSNIHLLLSASKQLNGIIGSTFLSSFESLFLPQLVPGAPPTPFPP